MLPSTISRKLSSLRRYERGLRLLWGVARWVAVALVLLALACLTDWAVDRYYETPWPLRVLLFVGQIAVGAVLAFLWLVRPQAVRLRPADLALLVEEKTPWLRHRLISVVQFHQPGAQTGGMSRELIVRVTEETVEQTSDLKFTSALDKRRVGWSFATLLPVVTLAALPVLLWPELVNVLLQRQMLQNVAIPRSVYLDADNPPVWPKGEDIVLRFKVRGEGWTKTSVGQVRVDPDDQPTQYFELEYEDDAGPGEAIFVTPPKDNRDTIRLPTLTNFSYRAWLEDGRSASANELQFVPRPVVDSQQIRAWVQLPPYVPMRPTNPPTPYEIEQTRGDIVALEGSAARVWIKIQKPVAKATLHLLGPAPLSANPTVTAGVLGLGGIPFGGRPLLGPTLLPPYLSDANLQQSLLGPELLLDDIPMALSESRAEAEAVFDLPATATGYRLVVEDEYGFKNIPAPRRSIRIVPEEAPRVIFLPVLYDPAFGIGTAENFPMDGLPIAPVDKIRIAYRADAPFGIGSGKLHYRVHKGRSGSLDEGAPPEVTPWYTLDLIEKAGTEDAGPFLPDRGIFRYSKDSEQIQLHAVPSPSPEFVLGRKIGGGRFDFFTENMLLDNEGKRIPLQPGDQVEYRIEVTPARGPKDTLFRKPGISETRVVSVVTELEAAKSMFQYSKEIARLKQLKTKQAEVDPDGR